jgi:UDP-glucose 4-epimerase
MKILITGGAGFIGSHLAEYLLARGEEVHCLDDLSTGSIHNISHLKDNDKFSYTIGSVTDEQLVAEYVDWADFVYHLAAAVGVELIVNNPVRTIETNIRGTEAVLRHASKKKRPVLITSTSETYGKNENVPFKEDDDMVLGPTSRARWSYACSKAIDEFLGLSYWHERELPVIIVRLFNTVGPRQVAQYGMVLPRFVTQALKGEPITVYGDGKQSRCFAYVSDVIEAMVNLAGREEACGQVFNIGSHEEITIEDLAKLVKKLLNSGSPIEYIPYEKAYAAGFEDMRRRAPDTGKIAALTGYKPKHGIEDIIRLVAEHIQKGLTS